MNSWLGIVRNRLAGAGFVILENVRFDGRSFPVVARRSRFELTKFGFSENFFIFEEFDDPTTKELRAFSADAYRYAKKHRAIWLPCGLFESVWSYAVAITREVNAPILASVRTETPPKHWASAEIPVVYVETEGTLAYFEKTPLWGAAYYAGFRKQIQRLLGENG
jgi:hypothetical protein